MLLLLPQHRDEESRTTTEDPWMFHARENRQNMFHNRIIALLGPVSDTRDYVVLNQVSITFPVPFVFVSVMRTFVSSSLV